MKDKLVFSWKISTGEDSLRRMYAKFSEKLAILTSYVRVRIRGGGGGGGGGGDKLLVFRKILRIY